MTLREERNHALGFGILFFVLTFVYGFLAYKLFSSGTLIFGAAMIVLTFFMAGTSTFCARHFLICRYAEQEMKKGNEEK